MTDRLSKGSGTTHNESAQLISRLLQVKRPDPGRLEPELYTGVPEAVVLIRRVTGMTQAELAFKLGISLPMVVKVEAGDYGGNLQIPEMEKLEELVKDMHLPRMSHFLHLMVISLRRRPRRGPKRNNGPWHKQQHDIAGATPNYE